MSTKWLRSILLCFFCLVLAPHPQAQVLNQPQHRKILLDEAWTGAYLHSDYNEVLGHVRFDFCEHKKGCDMLGEYVPIEDLELYKPALIADLRSYRNERAAELDAEIWALFTGGSQNSEDLQVLDGIISDIERDGVRRWLLLTEECLTQMPLEISSIKMTRDLAEVLEHVFSQAPPVAEPSNTEVGP